MEIINLEVTNIQDDSVEISWRTSEPATTKVKYGEELAAVIYNHQTPENERYTFDHSVLLLDLKPATTYHFRAISVNRSGERAESQDKSFNTLVESTEGGEQTTDIRRQKTEDSGGFAALISPEPSALGASTQKAPRLNPYADVLGQYDALTPTSRADMPYQSSNYPYSYPNYQGGYPYPPVAIVYPPNYAPQQNNTQPQVLAQQATPTPTVAPTATPTVALANGITESTSLFLIIGLTLGILIAGIYWRFGQRGESAGDRQEETKSYQFSIG